MVAETCGPSFTQRVHWWLWVPDRVRCAHLSGTTSVVYPTSDSIFKQPTTAHISAFSRRDAPEVCQSMSLDNQRAQGMPGAQCARGLACKIKQAHELVTTVTPERPGIPRAMVLRLTSRSPRLPRFLTPSPA